MTTTAIVPGSLMFVATQAHQSIAESFVNADAVIVVDTSASMSAHDSRGGQSRFDVACLELARLQHDMPGRLAVIAFSDSAEFCPSGAPRYMGSGTNLAGALKFARVADVPGMHFIVVSDGLPDDEGTALTEARQYQNAISTIYTGPEGESAGRDFLARLSAISGGHSVMADRAQELAAQTKVLLLS